MKGNMVMCSNMEFCLWPLRMPCFCEERFYCTSQSFERRYYRVVSPGFWRSLRQMCHDGKRH